MAYTQLANVIYPNSFSAAVTEAVTAKSALLQSGAVITSNEMSALASQAGNTGTLPTFNLQAYSDPDIARDDSQPATINAISMKPVQYQKDYMSKTWGEAQLAASVSGQDLLGHIVNDVVAPYWVDSLNRLTLKKTSGIIKDNIANDGGDMVYSVGTDATGTPAASEVANINTINEAMATMGDAFSKLRFIIMHSRVFFNLMKLEPVATKPASQTEPFATYMGMPVLIDDNMPAVKGTNRTKYTTYLMGEGFFALGEANLGAAGTVLKEDPIAGGGWGLTSLTNRKQIILQATVFSSAATVAANTSSPTFDAYDTATAWDRKVDRKNAALVALVTNG